MVSVRFFSTQRGYHCRARKQQGSLQCIFRAPPLTLLHLNGLSMRASELPCLDGGAGSPTEGAVAPATTEAPFAEVDTGFDAAGAAGDSLALDENGFHRVDAGAGAAAAGAGLAEMGRGAAVSAAAVPPWSAVLGFGSFLHSAMSCTRHPRRPQRCV